MRPWPLFIGPQAKLGRLTLSFEVGFNNELSFGLIATIGYRWFFKNLEKQLDLNYCIRINNLLDSHQGSVRLF